MLQTFLIIDSDYQVRISSSVYVTLGMGWPLIKKKIFISFDPLILG